MNRRELLRLLAMSSAAAALPIPKMVNAADFQPYSGELLVTIQADGGWDVASFCDPKLNMVDTIINNWAVGKTATDIPVAGAIPYAPFANNAAFFDRFKNDMLVINGVDMQTNAHSAGVLHSWSGRPAAGYPSLTALFAMENAPALPLSYLNFGGYSETARLLRYSRIDNIDALVDILRPNVASYSETLGRDTNFFRPTDLERLVEFQQARLARMQQDSTLLPRQQYAMDAYYSARSNTVALEQFAAVIPPDNELQQTVTLTNGNGNLFKQAQIAALAFKAGVASSADLFLNGFDTHSQHDVDQASRLGHLTDAITYLWDYAAQLQIDDRLTIVIGSDFSRTPRYNEGAGKDHWPIGSVVVMNKGAAWGNRVVGATDEGQNAIAINPTTLLADGSAGATNIYPKHVHQAIRRELGIPLDPFPLNSLENMDFFDLLPG